MGDFVIDRYVGIKYIHYTSADGTGWALESTWGGS